MKLIYIVISLIFLGLGVLGVILPVLPTTPFVLLSSFFALKGSKRLDKAIKSSKLYQNHVETFVKTKAMTLKSKISILSFASFMLMSTFYFTSSNVLRVFIILIMVIKYATFIFWIETIEEARI